MNGEKIAPYIEPIFRFCRKRISNLHDAEDLSSEIVCHILDGMRKYDIKSLDAWVWRIAHNRYARYVKEQKKKAELLSDKEPSEDDRDYCVIDFEETEDRFEDVFRLLHSLAAEYRNIFVDYYVGELSVRELSKKYSLSETTIKWRLNVGREKIRNRIGETHMDRIYGRINWNTTCCNGSFDSDKYLHTQIARAICKAAYEKPLSVEEISLITGIPAMYIEDELPRLEYGDAIRKVENKYVTDFIIFSLENRKMTEKASLPLIRECADRIEALLNKKEDNIRKIGFYGSDFGTERLGHILVSYLLRQRERAIKEKLGISDYEDHPPRTDGGYGWYIVEETVDESETYSQVNYAGGVNIEIDEAANIKIYNYWLPKYIDISSGLREIRLQKLLIDPKNVHIEKEKLSDETASFLLEWDLIVKDKDGYKPNFPCLTRAQFDDFVSLFALENKKFDALLTKWMLSISKCFKAFVPKHLESQVNQWTTAYINQLISYVKDELIHRGCLRKPRPNEPFTDGVFLVKGKYINP